MVYQLLVVDDSQTLRRAVQVALSKEDFDVIAFGDAQAALTHARARAPAAILLDTSLPNCDTYAICKQLRQDPLTQRIPICLLAGNNAPYDAARAEAAGVRMHVVKPFETQALIDTVKGMVGATITAAAQSVVWTQPPIAAPPPAPAPIATLPEAPVAAPVPLEPIAPIAPPPALERPSAASASPPISRPPMFPSGVWPTQAGTPQQPELLIEPSGPPLPLPLPPTAAPIPVLAPMRPLRPTPSQPHLQVQPLALPDSRASTPASAVPPKPIAPARPPAPAFPAPVWPPQQTARPPAAKVDAQALPTSNIVAPAHSREAPLFGPPATTPPGRGPAKTAEELLLAIERSLPPPPPATTAVASEPSRAIDRATLDATTRAIVEQVVWEVVPQLAETLIRERLDELARRDR